MALRVTYLPTGTFRALYREQPVGGKHTFRLLDDDGDDSSGGKSSRSKGRSGGLKSSGTCTLAAAWQRGEGQDGEASDGDLISDLGGFTRAGRWELRFMCPALPLEVLIHTIEVSF